MNNAQVCLLTFRSSILFAYDILAIGDANTIGVIPFFLGGGISLYSGQFGFGSDNILSARVVTSDGSLLEASETTNQDLFWAIRGAGQFFGVVTELTIRTYPLSTLGSTLGGHCFCQLTFPISQAREVAMIMKELMVDPATPTSGHLMIVSRPPDFQQVIVINAHYIGNPDKAQFAFQQLTDLNPIEKTTRMLLFENHSDFPLAKSSPGDIRSINLIGLAEFTSGKFLAMAQLHQDLIRDYPDAKGTQVIFGWRAPVCQLPITDTSFGNAGQLLWL
ncbi:FAD-binding type 2 [Penicillium coprophilum]|uniref:FAD-binding type 2 n=1 Tax=Penicillium coprophilum TaxID=36646 RepID=UPI00239BCAC6|nr:FAD-binding type 2 [Penicillium coprophilum]KAJ5154990.1 FAD-binding type 2 [Penicillium coprophilum]